MKIRNGFVSNSSSSSFVLSYDKTEVISDPKDLVELLKKGDENILFKGWDCGEGDDIFTLSKKQSSLIRKFPEEFIKQNTGTVKRDKYIFNEETEDYKNVGEEDVPKITAYINAILTPDKYEYTDPEVDMSDFGPEPSFDIKGYIPPEERTPEQVKQYEYENAWYEEHRRRVCEARKKYRAEALESAREKLISFGVSPENATAEYINISNRSCSEDSFDEDEFVFRYFTSEEDFYEQPSFKMTKASLLTYGIIYNEVYQDKKEIINRIENHPDHVYGISRCNPIINTVKELENINVYILGPEERNLLLANKEDFLKSNLEYVLFDNPEIFKNGDSICSPEGKILLGHGYVYFGKAGENLIDFKKEIIKGKISNTYLKRDTSWD